VVVTIYYSRVNLQIVVKGQVDNNNYRSIRFCRLINSNVKNIFGIDHSGTFNGRLLDKCSLVEGGGGEGYQPVFCLEPT